MRIILFFFLLGTVLYAQDNYDVKKSPANMQLGEIADRLGLTDKQRADVTKLLAERAQMLSKEPEQANWQAIYEENDKKLLELLSPDQLKNWPNIFTGRRIRINVNSLTWEETLNWLAGITGHQLIMDSPPPGTFTYSDSREYTATEILDIVNGVLQTKGFTLVRNDKTLMLFDLRKGPIPLQYVPKVQPEELAEQGKFSYVALTVKLERRDRGAVEATMLPFKGPYNRIVPLPGNALMIVDTAATLSVLERLAMSVQNPDPPKQPDAPPPPAPVAPPHWETYIVEKNDPTKIEQIVTEFIGGKCLRLPGSRELHFFVTPDQHGNIRTILDRLETGSESGSIPVVVSYPLDGLLTERVGQRQMNIARMLSQGGDFASRFGNRFNDPNMLDPTASIVSNIVALLKQISPAAVIAPNSVANKLVVFAAPKDQEKIKTLFESLKQDPDPSAVPIFKIYQFADKSKKVGNEIATAMRQISPNSMMTLDENVGIYCVATEKEHEQLAAAFQEIESQTLKEEDNVFVVYPVTTGQMERFNSLFLQIARGKDSEFESVVRIRDSKPNQLTIWATPKQHLQIKRILAEISNSANETAASSFSVGVFPLRRGNAHNFMLLLQNTIPGAEISIDWYTNSIIAYGSAEKIAMIEKAVSEFDASLERDVVFIALQKELDANVMRLLQNVVQQANVVYDAKNNRIMVFGRKNEVDQVEKIVKSYIQSAPAGTESFRFYDTKANMPSGVLDFLRLNYPKANVQYDSSQKRYTAVASDAEHLQISKLIIEAENSLPPEEETRYFAQQQPVTDNLTTFVRDNLKNQGLDASVVKKDDSNALALVVRARPNALEKIPAILEQSKNVVPSVSERVFRSYFITQEQRTRFDSVKSDLFAQIGDVKTLTDNRNDVLSFWALPMQHEHIAKLLEDLTKESSVERKERVLLHSLKTIDFNTLQSLIKEIYPDVKITEDSANARIVIRVRPEFEDAVKSLIEQLDTADPERVKRYFKSYELDGFYTYDAQGNYFHPMNFLRDIQKLAPAARVTIDYYSQKLIIWGTDEEQKIITESVSNLQKNDSAKRFQTYPIKRAEPFSIISMISRLFPRAVARYDYYTRTIVVESNPHQLESIGKMIAVLDPEELGPNDPVVLFHRLNSEPTDALLAALRQLAPSASITPDKESKQLMIIAKPSEQKILAKNIETIVETFTAPEEPMLFLYPVSDDQRKRLEAFLTTAKKELQSVQILQDGAAGQISIWAKPREHKLISDVLMQIQAGIQNELGLKLRSYPLSAADVETAQSIVKSMYPEAKLMPDKQGGRLLIWANDADHLKIESTLKIVDTNVVAENQPKFETFLLDAARFENLWTRYSTIMTIIENLRLLVPNAKIIAGTDYRRIIVWGTAPELEIVKSAIGKIARLDVPDDPTDARSFFLKTSNPQTIIDVLSSQFPDAIFRLEAAATENSPLFVFARKSELVKIEDAISKFENANVKSEQMLQYPITGTKTEIAIKAIKEMYSGLRITEDARSSRLFVWASPDEHVEIAKIVAQFNEEGVSDMSETFAAYPIPNLYYYSAIQMLRTMFPGIEAFGDYSSEKITVKASGKEQKQIRDILEQMQSKDTGKAAVMMSYPIGDADPALIEMLLQGLLPDAESKSPQEVKDLLGAANMSTYNMYGRNNRNRMYGYFNYGNSTQTQSYYRVDPKSKSAVVLAPQEDQKPIPESINALIASAQFAPESSEKFVAQIYSLSSMRAAEILPTLKQIALASRFVPSARPNDFIAYGPFSEQQKIAAFVKQLNDSDAVTSRRVFNVISLPPGTKHSRNRVLRMLQILYPELADSPPAPGVEPNQIVFWGTNALKERIQSVVNETCKPLPEDQQTILRTYNTRNITESTAINWLQSVVPNAVFQMDGRSNYSVGHNFVVTATPIEHAEIEKILSEIDKDIPQDKKSLTRLYSIQEIPFQAIRRTILEIAPFATLSPSSTPNDFIAYANEHDHKLIAEFIDGLNAAGPSETKPGVHVLSLPDGTSNSRRAIIDAITNMFPRTYPTLGPESNQIVVFCPNFQKEQIAKLIEDTAKPLPDGQQALYVTYYVKNITDARATYWLMQMFPNIKITADGRNATEAGNAFIVYASPFEHLRIKAALLEIDKDTPDGIKPQPKTYSLDNFPPTIHPTLISALRRTFPLVFFSGSTDRPAVLAVTDEDTHLKIDSFIKNFAADRDATAPFLEIYNFSKLNVWKALPILQQLSPNASLTPGALPDQLYVFAMKRDQSEIANAILKMETAASKPVQLDENGKSIGPSLMLYRIESRNAYLMSQLLQSQFAGSIIFPIRPDQIFVWANAADHAEIQKVIGSVSDAFQEPYLEMYTTKHAPIGEAFWLLQSLFAREAVIVQRRDSGDLAIQAIADVHVRIKKSIEQLDVPKSADAELAAVSYDLSELQPTLISVVRQNISQAMPHLIVMPSATNGQIIVYAKAADQTKVRSLVGEIVKKTPDSTPRMETYTFQRTTAAAAMPVLQQIAPNAQPGFGNDPRQILIWASGSDHQKIKEAVERMNASDPNGSFPKHYRFKKVSVSSVWQILQIQVPGITMAADPIGDLLLVTATPTEHAKIEQIVADLDKDDPETQTSLRVHPVGNINATDVYRSIRSLYVQDPRFQMYYNAGNGTFVALARSQQHKFIGDLIKQIQEGEAADPNVKLAIYSFKNMGYGIWNMVQQLLDAKGIDFDKSVQYDYYSSQVAIRVRPEIHAEINVLLNSLKPEEKSLDVFVLETVDPDTAQLAIRYLFYDEDYSSRPIIQVDTQTNTVFVRGTQKQIEQIRNVLIKLGEKFVASPLAAGLAPANPAPASPDKTSKLRVLKIDGDVNETLQQLQKVWTESEDTPLIINRQDEPIINESSKSTPFSRSSPRNLAAASQMPAPAFQNVSYQSEKPPVYITDNTDGTITIASFDVDALNKIEHLLAAGLAPALPSDTPLIVYEGRDYTIFSVRNINVNTVASRLQLILRDRLKEPRTPFSVQREPRTQFAGQAGRTGTLELTPDLTSNTLQVRGTKIERSEVAKLLPMLDVSSLPGEMAVRKPIYVPIESTTAARIAQQVLSVYQQKMMMTQLPGGVYPRVTVDTLTNSVVIIAPDPLASEMKAYAEDLDKNTLETPGRKLHLIQLEDVNASVIQQAIRIIQQTSPRSGR